MSVLDLEALNASFANIPLDPQPTGSKDSPRCSSDLISAETKQVQPADRHIRILPSHPSAGVTFCSTPSEKSPTVVDQPNTPSGRESPISGKPPGVVDLIVSRAISRRQTNPWAPIDQPLSQLSTGQTAGTMAEYLNDDSILEPFPYERVSVSLSELVAPSPRSFEGSIDLTRFGGHRDTFAILGRRRPQHPKIDLPASFFEHLLPFIDFSTYLSIRLCCRSWSSSISQVHPMATPAAFRIPTEILQQIFRHLNPMDFNSARHACRAWMIASLDPKLLKGVLKHGGWVGAAIADEVMIERSPQMAITHEWPLSKRVATECQLMSNWTGSGLPQRCAAGEPRFDEFQQSHASTNYPALTLGAEVDFSRLTSSSTHASERGQVTNFTPSVCGKYVLVMDDCTIYVFSLGQNSRALHGENPKAVEAITSVVCPGRVLAVSMDTSYGRFTVAALLEDRVGLVCDLQNTQPQQQHSRSHIPSTSWKYGSRWNLEGSEDEMEIDEPRLNLSQAFEEKMDIDEPEPNASRAFEDRMEIDEHPHNSSHAFGEKMDIDEPEPSASRAFEDKLEIDESPHNSSHAFEEEMDIDEPESHASLAFEDEMEIDDPRPNVPLAFGDEMEIDEPRPSASLAFNDEMEIDQPRSSASLAFEDKMEIDEPRPNSSLAFYNRQGKMCPWAKGETPLIDTPERYGPTPPQTRIPVEKGYRSIYRNVCSPQDGPRNVAICPHRRCVAFGCSAGIELHWTDPFTGQNQNRWCPLTNPSDYLSFIPPRAGIDSVERLRLAPSVVHPSEQAALLNKYAPQMLETRQDEMVWECTSNMAFDASKEFQLPDQPDSYHVVRLSDGYHFLYTDPETDEVCLGFERSSGVPGESKFVKRVILRSANMKAIPKCYAAAAELSWSVRIAVGYANGSVWCFSVPRDMFLASQGGETTEPEWLHQYETQEGKKETVQTNNDAPETIVWPRLIRGVEVAQVKDLENVCVDASNGSLAIWAFSADGFLRRWHMNDGLSRRVKKSIVLPDGDIVRADDDDGDWIMRNALG